MSRFYLPPNQIQENHFQLAGTEAYHAIHVLRKKVGDLIELFDGKDLSYQGKIESIDEQNIRGILLEHQPTPRFPVSITLYQALLKGSKWDWLLEKVCELGVERVVPVLTKRTLIQWTEPEPQKVERWNRIALAASKQSGRSSIMQVTEPVSFNGALQTLSKSALHLIPWEKEMTHSISWAMPQNRPEDVSIFIGPEGGWEPSEIEKAKMAGVIPVKLGPTILRTETAGLIASTLVFHEYNIY